MMEMKRKQKEKQEGKEGGRIAQKESKEKEIAAWEMEKELDEKKWREERIAGVHIVRRRDRRMLCNR